METKLEMAIQQVQLLQQANRERQQQQEANAQLALSAATWEVQSLKTRLDDLQVCCCTIPSTVLDECLKHCSNGSSRLAAVASVGQTSTLWLQWLRADGDMHWLLQSAGTAAKQRA